MLRHAIFTLFFLGTALARCQPGYFIDSNNECVTCPGNTYNHRIDAKSCNKCPNGKISRVASVSMEDCLDCPPGMQIVFKNKCQSCSPGTFNPVKNSKVCRQCPPGTFSNTYLPSFCRPCRAGRVTNQRGTSVCQKCKGDTYQPNLRRKKCIKCPHGSVANKDGASCKPTCNMSHPSCKFCPPGFQLSKNGKCRKCPPGTINRFNSVTKCQKCPDALRFPFKRPGKLRPNSDRTGCICRRGEKLVIEPLGPEKLNPLCRMCPDGLTSDGVTCSESFSGVLRG